jgi:hypothetical protein
MIVPRGDWVQRTLGRKPLYVFVGLTGLFLHLTLARPLYAWYDRVGAWVPLVILLVLLYQYVKQQNKTVPMLLLAALQIYVFYSVPQFSQERLILYSGLYEPSPWALSTAVVLVIIGEVAFILGYRVIARAVSRRPSLFDRLLQAPSPGWSGTLPLYAAPSLVVNVLISLRPDFIPASIRLLLSQVFNAYLALVLMLYVGYKFQLRRMLTLAFVLSACMSFVGFVQGVMGNMVNPLMVVFVSGWIWGGTIRKRWVFATLAAILVINPAKNQFRNMEFSEKDVSSLALVERRLDSWKVAFSDAWKENPTESNIMDTANRANDLLSLAQALDVVPSLVPYNYGQGMGVTLIYWIPRIVWPSKPESSDLLFNRYAVEFGYTTQEGTLTSTTGASAYTEGYWNFGSAGAVLFLLVIGMLLGFFFGNNGSAGDVSTIVAVVYFAGVMLLIQPLTLTASSLVTFTAGIWIAMRGLAWFSLSSGFAARPVRMRPLVGDR